MDEGNYARAVIYWTKLVRARPENVEAQISLAHCLNQIGNCVGAIQPATEAVIRSDQNIEARWERGEALFRSGIDIPVGFAEMSDYISSNEPGRSDKRSKFAQIIYPVYPARSMKVVRQMMAEFREKSAKDLSKEEQKQVMTASRYLLGLAAESMQFPEEAERFFQMVLSSKYAFPALNAHLAAVQAEMGKRSEAKASLERLAQSETPQADRILIAYAKYLIANPPDRTMRTNEDIADAYFEKVGKDLHSTAMNAQSFGADSKARAYLVINLAHLLSINKWKDPSTAAQISYAFSVIKLHGATEEFTANDVTVYPITAEQRLFRGASSDRSEHAKQKLLTLTDACNREAVRLLLVRATQLMRADDPKPEAAIQILEAYGRREYKRQNYAVKILEEALQLRKEHFAANKAELAGTTHLVGSSYLHQDDFKKALPYLRDAVALEKQAGSKFAFPYLIEYAVGLLNVGEFKQAAYAASDALGIAGKSPRRAGDEVRNEATSRVLLGAVLRAQGKQAESNNQENLAQQLLIRRFGKDSAELKNILSYQNKYNELADSLALKSGTIQQPSPNRQH